MGPLKIKVHPATQRELVPVYAIMIHLEKRVIYIAIPKTGSTTLRRHLEGFGFQTFNAAFTGALIAQVNRQIMECPSDSHDHIPLMVIRRCLGTAYPQLDGDSFFVFTTIRNPWDHLTSAYRHTVQFWGRSHSFEDYVKEAVEDPYYHASIMCLNEHGEDGCDYYLDTRDIDRELPPLLAKLQLTALPAPGALSSLPTSVGHCNTTCNSQEYASYYTDQTRELVRTHFEYEVERFGYSFFEKTAAAQTVKSLNTIC